MDGGKMNNHCDHECVCSNPSNCRPIDGCGNNDCEHDTRKLSSRPFSASFRISFDALIGIHGELSRIRDITDHIDSLLSPITHEHIWYDEERDAVIAKKERERVLDEALVWLYKHDNNKYDMPSVRKYIKSLRGEP